MRNRVAQAERVSTLPPFPNGWYLVATRASVLKRKLIEKQWMGEDIVVWSDDDGRICVADAYCPHLGSYLGPQAGGRVCDGRLVCPFHGFEFGARRPLHGHAVRRRASFGQPGRLYDTGDLRPGVRLVG